ncbi:GDP-mannose 4,6-dehydratase [Patescibacteria group bacterium]|nr:GDP-mannose 4,6-dehydratase [Patescibacteria group bacterium]
MVSIVDSTAKKQKKNGKKVLISGINGSGASYLAEYIVDNHPNWQVYGISRWHSASSPRNLSNVIKKVFIHECDLNDFGSIFNVLRIVKPDYIFHIASHANVRTSFIYPIAILQNNIIGTANLFEAIRATDIDPRIQLCSTSEVYGQVDPKNVPIRENCPMNPMSPYAVSKATQDHLGNLYFKGYGMKIIITRMFTYLNPRRNDLSMTSFAMQIACIEAGLQKELLHGNLDSIRSFVDVRDAMEAYWLAIEKCVPGEVYNIGGAINMSVGEFLEILKQKASCPIPSRLNPDLLRPADVTLQIPDISKFTAQTDWKPRYTFEESISFLLKHCRKIIRA